MATEGAVLGKEAVLSGSIGGFVQCVFCSGVGARTNSSELGGLPSAAGNMHFLPKKRVVKQYGALDAIEL